MPFVKGQSGNPAGGKPGPRTDPAFKTRCRKAVDELVISKWEEEVRNMGEHWVKCSELLAAYGYGKPAQSIEVSTPAVESEQVARLTDGDLLALIAATTDAAPTTH